jgi:predicted alpha/beta-fold hydrolase
MSTLRAPTAAPPSVLDDFRPLPLLSNPHLQTLLGFLIPGGGFKHPTVRRLVRLDDDDALVLHDSAPPGWTDGGRMALLIHGLTGSHHSPLIERLADALLRRGVRAVRLDLRGTGDGLGLARGCYHAGRSEDVRAALAEMHLWSPTSPLLLLGASLGGALALKLAGELPEQPVAGLERVVALGPPIDLERCAWMLGRPSNRLYENTFIRLLVAEARQRQRLFPDLPPLRLPRRLTIRLFDDLYTAPRCGFADALDYYHRASSLPLVGRIPAPTLILTARDDPFIAAEPFEALQPPPNVTVHILPHGGHLGFLGFDGAGGIRWAERRVVDWLLQPLDDGAAG